MSMCDLETSMKTMEVVVIGNMIDEVNSPCKFAKYFLFFLILLVYLKDHITFKKNIILLSWVPITKNFRSANSAL